MCRFHEWTFINLASFLISIAFFLPFPPAAQSHDLLSVYREAEATSPLLGRARALLQADRAGKTLARSALMPRVGARAGVSGDNARISGFGKDFITAAHIPGFASRIDKDFMGAHYSVILTQPIVDGQAWVVLQTSQAHIRSAKARLLAAEQSLITQVFNAYFGVLRACANQRVAVSQRDLLQRVLDQAQKALQIGTGDIIDVQEVRARFDAAQAALIHAENEVRISENRIEQLIHKPVSKPFADIVTLEPQGPQPDHVEPWLDAAMEHQPILRQAREQLQIAQDQVEFAQRSRWPKLNLESGYVYTRGGFLPSIESNHAQVGLTLSVPLYTGGEIAARVRQAEARTVAAQQETLAVQDQVVFDTQNAFLILQGSVAQLKASRQALESARVSLDAVQKGFAIGTRTIVDVLNAIRDNVDAERNHNHSLYNQVLARVQLKAAAGVLNVKDVEAVNELLMNRDTRTGP